VQYSYAYVVELDVVGTYISPSLVYLSYPCWKSVDRQLIKLHITYSSSSTLDS
jgi:hypothetical protein